MVGLFWWCRSWVPTCRISAVSTQKQPFWGQLENWLCRELNPGLREPVRQQCLDKTHIKRSRWRVKLQTEHCPYSKLSQVVNCYPLWSKNDWIPSGIGHMAKNEKTWCFESKTWISKKKNRQNNLPYVLCTNERSKMTKLDQILGICPFSGFPLSTSL